MQVFGFIVPKMMVHSSLVCHSMKKLLARVSFSPGLGVSAQQLLGSGAPGYVVFGCLVVEVSSFCTLVEDEELCEGTLHLSHLGVCSPCFRLTDPCSTNCKK